MLDIIGDHVPLIIIGSIMQALLHSLDDLVHDLREVSTFDVYLDGLIGTKSVGVSFEIV